MEYQQINMPGPKYKLQSTGIDYLPYNYMHAVEKDAPVSKKDSRKNKDNTLTKLCIKNMVSIRCIFAVKSVLTQLEIPFNKVELMNVDIEGSFSDTKRAQLKGALEMLGFELMEDRKSVLVEAIKNVIVEMVHSEVQPKTKFSEYLSSQLNHNYIYLSNLFSKVKGITIEQFILSHKIERVKQLLLHNELSLSEIAWKLQYSSVAHLSNQFKKITGVTPSKFKNSRGQGLIALENL